MDQTDSYHIFSHANLTDEQTKKPREVFILKANVFTWYWSDAHKATHIVSNGGAIIPVQEYPAVVASKLFNVKPKETPCKKAKTKT